LVFKADPTGVRITDLPHSQRALYPLDGHLLSWYIGRHFKNPITILFVYTYHVDDIPLPSSSSTNTHTTKHHQHTKHTNMHQWRFLLTISSLMSCKNSLFIFLYRDWPFLIMLLILDIVVNISMSSSIITADLYQYNGTSVGWCIRDQRCMVFTRQLNVISFIVIAYNDLGQKVQRFTKATWCKWNVHACCWRFILSYYYII